MIFVSKDNKEVFDIRYPNMKPTEEVIYNYIDAQKVMEKAEENTEHENTVHRAKEKVGEQKHTEKMKRAGK